VTSGGAVAGGDRVGADYDKKMALAAIEEIVDMMTVTEDLPAADRGLWFEFGVLEAVGGLSGAATAYVLDTFEWAFEQERRRRNN
jgi:hypothetical protein